jgi:adenylate kinase family enzyme
MTLDEAISYNLSGLNVAVLGLPASGKSHLAARLYAKNSHHVLISTDNYMAQGYEQSLYDLIEELGNPLWNTFEGLILEGVLCYRILRKGLGMDCWKPDVIFMVERSIQERERVYHTERDPAKLKNMKSFDLGLMNIWNYYLFNRKDDTPIFYINNTD